MSEKIKDSDSGWFDNILRALMYGLVIYFMFALSASCSMKNSTVNVEQRAAEKRYRDQHHMSEYAPLNEADLAEIKGYEWARKGDIRNHAACQERWTVANHELLVGAGCSKYVTEQNVLKVITPIPHHSGWDDGTTTAQCEAEIHAYWDPAVNDYMEQGETRVAENRMSTEVVPALKACSHYDEFRKINGLIQ